MARVRRVSRPRPQTQTQTQTQPATPPTMVESLAVGDMNLDEQIVAASNVMEARDGVDMFLSIIWDHRQDGHECLPYCVPNQMSVYLSRLDEDDLRLLLAVLLKDTVDKYMREHVD